jgi:hypothetical protein
MEAEFEQKTKFKGGECTARGKGGLCEPAYHFDEQKTVEKCVAQAGALRLEIVKNTTVGEHRQANGFTVTPAQITRDLRIKLFENGELLEAYRDGETTDCGNRKQNLLYKLRHKIREGLKEVHMQDQVDYTTFAPDQEFVEVEDMPRLLGIRINPEQIYTVIQKDQDDFLEVKGRILGTKAGYLVMYPVTIYDARRLKQVYHHYDRQHYETPNNRQVLELDKITEVKY